MDMRTFFLQPSTASNATEDREVSTSDFLLTDVMHQSSLPCQFQLIQSKAKLVVWVIGLKLWASNSRHQSFEVGRLKCRVGLRSSLAHAACHGPPCEVRKFFSLSFSKGIRNRSRRVFVNQYWKCFCACKSVLEVLSVSHAC